jgi:hypothetical protein
MCNVSLSSVAFPDRLKTSKVLPLYKRGGIHDIKNYRPMSISSVFPKNNSKIITQ